MATGTTNGKTVVTTTPNYHFGTTPSIFVMKAINAVDPMHPTVAELAQAAPGRTLPIGTSVVWTYQVYDEGDAPVQVTSVRDDAGTPSNPNDDFVATAILQAGTSFNVGDSNKNGLLDPGEVFLFTSAGASVGSATNWTTVAQTVFSYTDTTGAPGCPGVVHDPVGTPNSFADNIFTGGSSKDISGVGQWQWKNQMPQDKDDIEHAFGASVINSTSGHTLVFTGMDRYASNGNSTAGFWFFQSPVSVNANGTFSGLHTDGDLLLVVDFTVGGSNPVVSAFRWSGSDSTGSLVAIQPPAGSTFAVRELRPGHRPLVVPRQGQRPPRPRPASCWRPAST